MFRIQNWVRKYLRIGTIDVSEDPKQDHIAGQVQETSVQKLIADEAQRGPIDEDQTVQHVLGDRASHHEQEHDHIDRHDGEIGPRRAHRERTDSVWNDHGRGGLLAAEGVDGEAVFLTGSSASPQC